jgi:hypothetical protein
MVRAAVLLLLGLTSCLPWDPRPREDAGALDAGQAGGLAGGSAGGGAQAGGVGGGLAGGGAQAGGAAGGTPIVRDGGCFDGRCHPDCTPGAPLGALPLEAMCCLDDECQSGQCFDALGSRECVPTGMMSQENNVCGDMSDCPASTACVLAEHRCRLQFPTTLGDDGGATCEVAFDQAGCGFGPGGTGPSCRLPGQLRSAGPCCIERDDAGVLVSCLAAGTCRRDPPDSGVLVSTAGGRCPL